MTREGLGNIIWGLVVALGALAFLVLVISLVTMDTTEPPANGSHYFCKTGCTMDITNPEAGEVTLRGYDKWGEYFEVTFRTWNDYDLHSEIRDRTEENEVGVTIDPEDGLLIELYETNWTNGSRPIWPGEVD